MLKRVNDTCQVFDSIHIDNKWKPSKGFKYDSQRNKRKFLMREQRKAEVFKIYKIQFIYKQKADVPNGICILLKYE